MISLVAPGLLGKLPQLDESGRERFANLERLLNRADRVSAPSSYAGTLFELFGIAADPESDLPTAALCCQVEPGARPDAASFLLHADPLHLRPDQDRLLAFDFHHQPLTGDQAGQFAQAFNAHFADDGLRLFTPHPNRWYLEVDHVPRLRTRPLVDVIGRNIDLFLPQGEDAGRWRSWMNELQMLFFNLPVNQLRESQGQLPVNGLWFSGGGRLSSVSQGNGFGDLQGDCPLARGLQHHVGTHSQERLMIWKAPERAVLDADPRAWVTAISELDRLVGGMLGEAFRLFPCEGEAWYWKPSMRYRFWRPSRSLQV